MRDWLVLANIRVLRVNSAFVFGCANKAKDTQRNQLAERLVEERKGILMAILLITNIYVTNGSLLMNR